MPIMHIGYSNGYDDALRDVLACFESHKLMFTKKAHGLIMVILKRIYQERVRFFKEKELFDFIFTAEEKKFAGIKEKPPEPPRWEYKFISENTNFGYCPCCRQEHLFFFREELLNTDKCPLCKKQLLPPIEKKGRKK